MEGPVPAPRRRTSIIPPKLRAWVVSQQRKHGLQWPRRGSVSLGDLRRVTPISAKFGLERGRPIDRYYIERFLQESAPHIRGRCLELGDAYYTKTLGGAHVTQA